MPTFAELACLVLATNQAVEVWRHSRLTAAYRDRVDQGVPPLSLPAALQNLVQKSPPAAELCQLCANFSVDLLACPWCTSVWTGGAVWLLWLAGPLGHAAVMALAVSRGANLLNDAAYCLSRTPKAR